MGEAKKEEQARQELVDLGASTTKTSRGTIYTLTIIGQIEGHQALPENIKTTKYEHVIPLLAAVEESEDIDGLLLLLNTVGGDIEAGLAIAELIAGMKKPTVSLVPRPRDWSSDVCSSDLGWSSVRRRRTSISTRSRTRS